MEHKVLENTVVYRKTGYNVEVVFNVDDYNDEIRVTCSRYPDIKSISYISYVGREHEEYTKLLKKYINNCINECIEKVRIRTELERKDRYHAGEMILGDIAYRYKRIAEGLS